MAVAGMAMNMTMAVPVSVTVVVLVKEGGADEVESKPDASNYQHKLWVFDMLKGNKTLNGLQEDAQTQRYEEGAVEEGAEELRTYPAKVRS
ncbi:hypothetical protein N0V86_001652 [Didymella sp. IMI 355093]|nr:hypothetical protein N0V86_001652 [Didymella sp. IMI 355093]